MGRARKDEMREANNSHIGHFMRGGRASSSSSEDSLSPRPRGRHTERVERTDFILTSQERAAKDLDRDRDRDRDRSFPKEKSSSRERSPSVPRKARAAPSSSPRREEMAPPMASAASDPLSTERIRSRQARFGTGVSTGGGGSGAAAGVAPRPVVAPRPARSPSPDLREVAADHFIENHLHRTEDDGDLGEYAKAKASERGRKNTIVSIPHEGRKEFHRLLQSPEAQTELNKTGKKTAFRIGPVMSSSVTATPTGEIVERKEKMKGRILHGWGHKGKMEHFDGYESE